MKKAEARRTAVWETQLITARSPVALTKSIFALKSAAPHEWREDRVIVEVPTVVRLAEAIREINPMGSRAPLARERTDGLPIDVDCFNVKAK